MDKFVLEHKGFELTNEKLREIITKILLENNIDGKFNSEESLKRDLKYVNYSRKELEEILPDGYYNIGSLTTGKGGYIRFLEILKEHFKENGTR